MYNDTEELIHHINRSTTGVRLRNRKSSGKLLLSHLMVNYQIAYPVQYKDIGEQRGYGTIIENGVYMIQHVCSNESMGFPGTVFTVRDREIPKYTTHEGRRVMQQVFEVHFMPMDNVIRDDIRIYQDVVHGKAPAFSIRLPTPLNEAPDDESRSSILDWAIEEAIGTIALTRLNRILEWDSEPLLKNLWNYEADNFIAEDIPSNIKTAVTEVLQAIKGSDKPSNDTYAVCLLIQNILNNFVSTGDSK